MSGTKQEEVLAQIDKIIGELESLKTLVREVWKTSNHDDTTIESADVQSDSTIETL